MSSSSKNSKMSSSSSPLNLLYLPDDLLWNCLARVSRMYYPNLSLVSKRFRSLLTSLELYETRTLLGCTESCLYLCLRLPSQSNSTRWFTLCQRAIQINDHNPNPNPNPRWFTPCFPPSRLEDKKLSDENVLVSIPPGSSCSVLIAVGYSIYMIGGFIDGAASSRVFFMDCRSHTWQEAPRMRVPRKSPRTSVLDGKIYVVEAYTKIDSSYSIECYDPKTRKWEDLPSPGGEMHGKYAIRCFAMEGNLYLYGGDKIVVYNPKENRWDEVEWKMYLGTPYESSCVIDNVCYDWSGFPEMIKWYDYEKKCWRVLKDLENFYRPRGHIKLVNNGGNIAVLWEEFGSNEKMIWCAEISLERRNEKEICGKVECCDVVLTVPKYSCNTQFVVATV